MPPSPAMRCSPGRELRGDNHKRGRSLEAGILFREKDDDLALFNEMQTREKDSFLLQSNDDFEDIFSTKLNYFSDYKLGISIPGRGESSGLLNADGEKNDYEWLLTPPDTPLFPSLDDETPLVTLAQRGRPQSQPITISRSSTMEKNRKSSRGLSAAPMEISLQSATDNCGTDTSEQNGIVSEPPPPPLAEDKVLVSVEVCLKPSSTARIEDVRSAVEIMLEKRSLSYIDGPVPVPLDDSFLVENVQRICVCDTDEWVENHDILLFWQVKPAVHVFQLSEEGPCEELSGDGQLSSFNEWILPAKEFDGMWESLIYESGLKQRLLRYAASALLFSEKGVDPCLISWNRIILLHGPPGTGKTSLCKALAQKLSIRFSSRYPQCQLVEVNAHSLFSKWFSESGKLVAKLFQKIQEMVEEENNLVFVLIDEVESLAAARQAALSGSEPSDSIRVVNALLTQMDKLKSATNVIILTTSNITAAIDIAFVDRADIKAYVGPPTLQARYEILRSCLQELLRTGILSNSQGGNHLILLNYASLKEKLNMPVMQDSQSTVHLSKQLLEAAEACEGLSGRALRKLPFLTHAALANPCICDPSKFLGTMIDTSRRECSELPE